MSGYLCQGCGTHFTSYEAFEHHKRTGTFADEHEPDPDEV